MSSIRHSARRLYQCPGCWAYALLPRVDYDESMECDCGEALTLIDLRELPRCVYCGHGDHDELGCRS